MAKKVETNIANSDIIQEKIVLRSVYGKNIKYYLNPVIDPLTGRYPSHIRQVDHHGVIILSESDKEKEGKTEHFIAVNEAIIVEDGKTFDLTDLFQKAEWEAIKNHSLIAKSRTEKNADGSLKIDGTVDKRSTNPRYGKAELYIDRPGLETLKRVTKKKKYRDALTYIMEDERGYEGRLLKAELLGRIMKNQPDSNVEDFLFQIAEQDPDKIIALYTGDDIQLRLLFLHAKNKKIIIFKNKTYNYGENIIAATDEAVITWMKQARNKNLLDLIRKETYPELYDKE